MHECNQAISGWKEYHMSENTISLYVYKLSLIHIFKATVKEKMELFGSVGKAE